MADMPGTTLPAEPADVTAVRAAARTQARQARAGLSPDERAVATAAVTGRVLAVLDGLGVRGPVAVYAAMRGELGTTALATALVARGTPVAYPVVRPAGEPLVFRAATPAELVPGTWGILEPPPTCPTVALDELAAVIVPGLVFDRRGNRLGWGAGHYDRTLARCPDAIRVGVAFERQLVLALDPRPHDIPVHFVATEVALHPGAPRAPRGTPS